MMTAAYAFWAIAISLILLGILRSLEIAIEDDDRKHRRKEVRQAMLDKIEQVNFLYPHEQVDWDDLTRQTELYR